MGYTDLVNRLRKKAIDLPEKFSKNADTIDLVMRAADAIEALQSIVPHNCFCCVGCEVEPKDGSGCETGFVLSPKRAKAYMESLHPAIIRFEHPGAVRVLRPKEANDG